MAKDRLGQLGKAPAGRGKGVQEFQRVGIGLPLIQSGQLAAPLFALAFEVVELLVDLGEQLALVVVLGGEGGGQPLLLSAQILDGSRECMALALQVAGGAVGDGVELAGEALSSVGVEDPLGEEVQDAVQKVVLADVKALGVVGDAAQDPDRVGFDGGATVVDPAVLDGAAAQAPAAVRAPDMGAEHVGALGAGMTVGVGAVAGAFVLGGDLGGLGVLFQGDDGRMSGFGRPDPLVGWPPSGTSAF